MENIINELRRIASLTPADLTQEDKQFIKEQAQVNGVEFQPKSACKSCYIDTAIIIYRKLKDENNAHETGGRLWILKEGVDVIWRNIRINAETITDEKAEEYIKCGFPTKFFV